MLAKRFDTLASYRTTEAAGYKLLPLRFTALDQSRYVLSNFVGEFRVVSRNTVEELVTHKLPPGSAIYDDLKAGHFLYDADSQVAIDLLGLKYRTKLGRIANFTGLGVPLILLPKVPVGFAGNFSGLPGIP